MRILSLDGGGYLGLASAAFLNGLESHFQRSCTDRFDLFCGTSTGAIIALALAAGHSAHEVVELYNTIGRTVFPPTAPIIRWYRKWIWGMRRAQYPQGPLAVALADVFGETTLGDLSANGKRVLVTAYSLTAGTPRIFKTNHSARLTRDDGYKLRDIALASAAAPLYFPMVPIADPQTGIVEIFCDGGVFANSPALLGFAEAVCELGVPARDVALLSVSTPRADLAEHASLTRKTTTSHLNRGLWRWKRTIADVMVTTGARISEAALQRIINGTGGGQATYQRIEFARPAGLDLDVATPGATATLRGLGNAKAAQADVRQQLTPFFKDE